MGVGQGGQYAEGSEKYKTRKEAMQREAQLKNWTKADKETLIQDSTLGVQLKHNIVVAPVK